MPVRARTIREICVDFGMCGGVRLVMGMVVATGVSLSREKSSRAMAAESSKGFRVVVSLDHATEKGCMLMAWICGSMM